MTRRRQRGNSQQPGQRPPASWRQREHRAASASGRTPLILLTGGAIVIALGFIIALSVAGAPRQTPSATSSSGTPSPGGTATGITASPSSSQISLPLNTPTVLTPERLADGRAVGAADAPATLTVWEDFQCPACGLFTREVEPRLYTDYVLAGKLRIVYRDFVFIGPESLAAAVAARCAGEQQKFWPYHDYLFWNQGAENSGAFDRAHLDAIANAVGLDLGAFDTCLGGASVAAQVKTETDAGQAAGIGSTPTLVVGKQVMPGVPLSDLQYTALRNVIDAAIEAAPSPTP